jgi:hypothetical protein
VWLCSGGHSWLLNMKVWKYTQISKTIRLMEKGCGCKVAKVRKSYPCNRLWRPIGFWDTRITHFLGNWLTGDHEVVSLTHPLPQEDSKIFRFCKNKFSGSQIVSYVQVDRCTGWANIVHIPQVWKHTEYKKKTELFL